MGRVEPRVGMRFISKKPNWDMGLYKPNIKTVVEVRESTVKFEHHWGELSVVDIDFFREHAVELTPLTEELL